MNWQAPGRPVGGAPPPPAPPPNDPFAAAESAIRGLVASAWWMSVPPPQRVEAITSRMLAGSGEWWLFGIWGRWYRCGLDGQWHLCPPPIAPAARQAVLPAPPGAGRPLVPPSIVPSGPDLTPGPLSSSGLFGPPPPPPVMQRLHQAYVTAAAAHPLQFPFQDPQFLPGTPGTVAACFFAVLWCAGAPVATAEHPILGLFSRHLSAAPPTTDPTGAGGSGPRWFLEPDLRLIIGAYIQRLRSGDPMGASHIARTLWETAEALRGEPAFRPRADALAAMAGAAMRMVQNDHMGLRYGDAAVIQEWMRRCPPDLSIALLRERAPGDHFRLSLYDLASAASALPVAADGPAEARRVAITLLAADLNAAPGAMHVVLPWLDPEAARVLHTIIGDAANPLRDLWPDGKRLAAALGGAEPSALRNLLAASYATALAWCRLTGTHPPRPGFTVPVAVMNAVLTGPSTGGGATMTPWEIIEAARAHLAEQREKEEAAEAAHAPPTTAEPRAPLSSPPPPAPQPGPPVPPTAAAGDPGLPATSAWPDSEPPAPDLPATSAWPGSEPPRPPAAAPPGGPAPRVVEAYGIRFLPGPGDVERLLTELRRHGRWARSLRGQDVSSASAPAVLLVGAASTGQRRITRMIARALADAGLNSGDIRALPADELTDTEPRELRDRLDEHGGHTLLLEGLDTLVLDDPRGAAYAQALYRARVEGVSDTTLVATCLPERLAQLTEASPELVTDFRTLRLPDMSSAQARTELAALLASERHLALTADAWEAARRDLGILRGRGRLTNARLVEAYLDRVISHHLSQAGETQVFHGGDAITLTPADFAGVVAELEP